VTGRLCEPEAERLAGALLQMAGAPAWRAKLGRQGLAAARARTWEAAMGQLADGYEALAASATPTAAAPERRLVTAA
jgi:glycosyltransferase involved in cell wall biosynthesis